MRLRHTLSLALMIPLAACGPSVTGGDDDDDTTIDARTDGPAGTCTPGVNVCVGTEVHARAVSFVTANDQHLLPGHHIGRRIQTNGGG